MELTDVLTSGSNLKIAPQPNAQGHPSTRRPRPSSSRWVYGQLVELMVPNSSFPKTFPFTINYLSGQVSGQVATDTIRLAQYEIMNQVFGLFSLPCYFRRPNDLEVS